MSDTIGMLLLEASASRFVADGLRAWADEETGDRVASLHTAADAHDLEALDLTGDAWCVE